MRMRLALTASSRAISTTVRISATTDSPTTSGAARVHQLNGQVGTASPCHDTCLRPDARVHDFESRYP